MPAYNAEKTIEESIKSVINQTFKEWELIIVDDASTDNTSKIIEKYLGDNRVRYFRNEVNLRVAETRNKALELANYSYIAFLDSDDIWLDTKLEKQVNIINQNDIAFTVSDYEIINNDGTKTNKFISSKNQSYKDLLKGSKIGCLTVLINKDKVKPFKFKEIGHEDYALWLEILRDNSISTLALNEVLAKHRLTDSSLSSNKKKTIKWQWDIYRKIEKKNFVYSSYLLFRYMINVITKTKKL